MRWLGYHFLMDQMIASFILVKSVCADCFNSLRLGYTQG